MATVFISHASADTPHAATLREWLVADGHDVFLDRDLSDGIAVGDEWEQRLHERLRWADATVCVVTSAYLDSTWCTAEVAIARARGGRMLPVRAEAGALHPLLKSLQHTDMIRDPAAARAALTAALRRVDQSGGVGWADGRSPFPGLRAFDADLHKAFFGRSGDVEALAGLLRSPAERAENTVLLVVGPSGCGKSSLVRAGLLPTMAEEPDWWTLPAFTPGVDPTARLAQQLAGLARDLDVDLRLGPIEDDLAAGRIVDVVERLLAATPGPRRKRLLVVIDQLEELLTQTPDNKVVDFAAVLRAALRGPIDIVATLRPEFLNQLLLNPDLAGLPTRTHTVRPLRREALRTVIEGPARLAGIRVSDELVAKLVDDTDTGDALPLLAFTLAQLAEGVGRGDELSMARYDSIEGVQGALSRQAEAALAEAMAATGRDRAAVIAGLLGLVTVDEQDRPTRWHVRRADLPAEVSTELDAFVAHRLLTVDTVDDEALIGASHEKFFTAWRPLAEAIKSTADALRARAKIEEAAAGWDHAGRKPEALWERGQLSVAVGSVGKVDLSPVGREFLRASAQRNRSRRRRLIATATVLLVIALVAGVIALVQQGIAGEQQRQAREQAMVATARQLVAKSDASLATDPRTALQLAVAAHRINPGPETYSALQRALTTTPYAGQLTGVASPVSSMAYSSTGRYLAAGYSSGAIMLWDLRDPLHPKQVGDPFIGFDSPVRLAFAANDSRLVTAGGRGAVVIWDLADPAHPRQLGNPVKDQKNVDLDAWLSPDGTVLATSGKDSPGIQLWDLTDPAQIRPYGPPLAPESGGIVVLAFSADSTVLAEKPSNSPVTLWDVRQRTAPRQLGQFQPVPDDVVDNIAFAADGKELAVSGTFRGIQLWNIADPAAAKPARDQIRVNFGSRVTFSPQGPTLATIGGRDVGVLLWDVSNPDFPQRIDTLVGGEDDRTPAFAPDGKTLATGSNGGGITLWNLGRAGRPQAFAPPFVGHTGRFNEIYALALSQDASMVATGGRDTTTELWDVVDPRRPRKLAVLTGHTEEGIDAVSFSPDGKLLATGGSDHKVMLWDLGDREHPHTLASFGGPTDIVRSLLFSPDGRTLIAGGDQATIFWDVRDPAKPRQIGQVLSKQGVLGIWRVRDGRVLAVIRGSGMAPKTTAVTAPTLPPTTDADSAGSAVSNGGSASGPTDGPGDPSGVRLWEITDPTHPHQLGSALLGHQSEVSTAAVSPAGDLLITSERNGPAILWDISDPNHARRLGDPLNPHSGTYALTAAFAPTTDLMVTGGIEGQAFLWDLGTPILPRQLGTALTDNVDAVYHLLFSADGSKLVSAGSEGDVVMWDLKPTYDLRAHLDETSCQVTRGGLDRDQWARFIPALDYQDTCSA
ncbi:TIR domain-containing protein [Kutzneria sp. NPDC052558]|uniref:nSTAND1 domain-containing NTPase n=1 Tax=Kutzneria sp. NPDC052558 TaxID=3364121 RepID=UPI0037C54E31